MNSLKRDVLRYTGSGGSQNVIHVEPSKQRRPHREGAVGRDNPKSAAFCSALNVLRPNVHTGRQTVHQFYIRPYGLQQVKRNVISIQDGNLRHFRLTVSGRQAPKQHGLGLAIPRVIPVIVQMLVCDVSYDRDVLFTAGHPMLGQAMGCRFQHHIFQASLHHLCQITLQVRRVRRRGVESRIEKLVSNLGIDRANHPCTVPARPQDRPDQVDRSRLAIRAGNAHHAQLASRITVRCSRHPGQGLTGVVNFHNSDLLTTRNFKVYAFLDHQRTCSAPQCITGEAMPIHTGASNGNKNVTRSYHT